MQDIKWLEDEIDQWFLGILVKEDSKGWQRFVRKADMDKANPIDELAEGSRDKESPGTRGKSL